MKIELGDRFWIAVTAIIMVLTVILVGRNVAHAVKIRRQITVLTAERDRYAAKVARDSTLIEQLRYDDYLEEFARERFRMQRPSERVYIVE